MNKKYKIYFNWFVFLTSCSSWLDKKRYKKMEPRRARRARRKIKNGIGKKDNDIDKIDLTGWGVLGIIED